MWQIIVSIFRKVTFSNVLFGLRMTKSLLGSVKNRLVVEKLNKAIDFVDGINKIIPNRQTDDLANKINNDQKVWKGFSATVVTDKHGKGNNGIVLGYEKSEVKILGFKIPGVKLKYDSTNGGFEGSIKL